MNQLHNPETIPNTASIHLSEKQIKYYTFILQGKPKQVAATLSGYSETSDPYNIEKSPNLRKALTLAMEAKGLTTEKLAEKLSDGVDKKKKFFSSYQGKIISEREIDDNETQVKYVRTALEIRGDLQEKAIEVNLGLITIPQMKTIDEWNSESEKV